MWRLQVKTSGWALELLCWTCTLQKKGSPRSALTAVGLHWHRAQLQALMRKGPVALVAMTSADILHLAAAACACTSVDSRWQLWPGNLP